MQWCEFYNFLMLLGIVNKHERQEDRYLGTVNCFEWLNAIFFNVFIPEYSKPAWTPPLGLRGIGCDDDE